MITKDLDEHNCKLSENMPTWNGINALISKENLTEKVVGFLPIIPHPITHHDTVYTLLRNLSSMCNSLQQDELPFFCDEGVYQYVVDIFLCNPEVFSNIVPLLGTFHMCKAALRCFGKYPRGSGMEDMFRPRTNQLQFCRSIKR